MITALGFKHVGMELLLILHFKDCTWSYLQKETRPATIFFSEEQFWRSHFELNNCSHIMLMNRLLLMWRIAGYSWLMYFKYWIEWYDRENVVLFCCLVVGRMVSHPLTLPPLPRYACLTLPNPWICYIVWQETAYVLKIKGCKMRLLWIIQVSPI